MLKHLNVPLQLSMRTLAKFLLKCSKDAGSSDGESVKHKLSVCLGLEVAFLTKIVLLNQFILQNIILILNKKAIKMEQISQWNIHTCLSSF